MQYLNPYIELCLEGPSSIFRGLNPKEKESIAEHHTIVTVKKGDYVFKEGGKTHGLIFVASGKVKVFGVGVGGREQILKMVNQYVFIGFMTLFTENIWSASAKAVEDSIICVLGKQPLIKIIKRDVDLAFRLLNVVSEELLYAYNRTISLTQKHVRGRLAESVLMLADIFGYEEDGKTIRAAISRDDIAHLSNMTTSNAIRTLSSLAEEGIIELRKRKLHIIDKASIQSISESG
jgi:CRP-like cAMP-binding protein